MLVFTMKEKKNYNVLRCECKHALSNENKVGESDKS